MPQLRCPACATVVPVADAWSPVCPRCGYGSTPHRAPISPPPAHPIASTGASPPLKVPRPPGVWREYHAHPSLVFRAACAAIRSRGYRVIEYRPDQGRVVCRTGMSWWSWGQRITATTYFDGSRAVIHFSTGWAGRIFPLQLYDWGFAERAGAGLLAQMAVVDPDLGRAPVLAEKPVVAGRGWKNLAMVLCMVAFVWLLVIWGQGATA